MCNHSRFPRPARNFSTCGCIQLPSNYPTAVLWIALKINRDWETAKLCINLVGNLALICQPEFGFGKVSKCLVEMLVYKRDVSSGSNSQIPRLF